ncbi:MAG: hypothetical protein JRJ66_02220 [Deltaproteobacteria bacterium]|nr:hypothetical protein [Deltaproteobacteria bacterium]
MRIWCGGSYCLIENKIKCDFVECYAGMGLAGSGHCFLDGAWWMQCCPEFRWDVELTEDAEVKGEK